MSRFIISLRFRLLLLVLLFILPAIGLTVRIGFEQRRLTAKVKDNDIGFDEKYLDRIFQPFQHLHNRSEYEGSGIGLAIWQKIAERHHGSIIAKRKIGQGTTFFVLLPVTQADPGREEG